MGKLIEMVKVFFVSAYLLLFSYAATSATVDGTSSVTHTVDAHGHGKKNPFTLEFVATNEMSKDRVTNEFNGNYLKLDTSLLYAASDKDEFRLYGSLMHQNLDGYEKETTFDLAEFMYRRKSILTEELHGVNMDLELKNYYLTDVDARDRYKFDGAFIPQLVFEKRLTKNTFLTTKLRRLFYYRSTGEQGTTQGETRVYLNPLYMVTHRLMLSALFTYKHTDRIGETMSTRRGIKHNKDDRLQFIPSVMYVVNRKLMMELYSDTYLMEGHDGQTWRENRWESMVYGINAYITAF